MAAFYWFYNDSNNKFSILNYVKVSRKRLVSNWNFLGFLFGKQRICNLKMWRIGFRTGLGAKIYQRLKISLD